MSVGWDAIFSKPLSLARSRVRVFSLSLDASKDEESTTSGHLFLLLTTAVVKPFVLNEVGLSLSSIWACFLFYCAGLRAVWIHPLYGFPLNSWRQQQNLYLEFPFKADSNLSVFMCVSQDPDGLGGHNSQTHGGIPGVSCAEPGAGFNEWGSSNSACSVILWLSPICQYKTVHLFHRTFSLLILLPPTPAHISQNYEFKKSAAFLKLFQPLSTDSHYSPATEMMLLEL